MSETTTETKRKYEKKSPVEKARLVLSKAEDKTQKALARAGKAREELQAAQTALEVATYERDHAAAHPLLRQTTEDTGTVVASAVQDGDEPVIGGFSSMSNTG